ncbi:MAG: hypothetical protein H6828_05930 [Planctomycetes bacterium]|nr:hypothetical protein [Planctomycetota bacterium]
MNRSIALFVALAVLVAHSLAIRTDAFGDLGPPYDRAYVAYHLARRWVFDGSPSWSAGVGLLESHASPLWVLLCALGERLYLPIHEWVRALGIGATATTFFAASRFHHDRIASLITPMLLAISGAMAAAAVNGTETAVLTMLVTVAFLAFERSWYKATSLVLLLAGFTRAEAWVLVPVFLFLRHRARRREKRGVQGPPAAPLWVFAPALLGMLAMGFVTWRGAGNPLPEWMVELPRLDAARLANGGRYLFDFFLSTASPLLLLYSLFYALRGRLTHTGAHSLAVCFAWAGVIVLRGGGETPFAESMVPVLPVALLSAQEAMIVALNSARSSVRSFAWVSFIAAVVASTLASLSAPARADSAAGVLHGAWTRPSARPAYGFVGALGREGLEEELRATQALRGVGLFLRDYAAPGSTVLTAWPGSIAYLSDLEVRDQLGRVTPAAPWTRPRPDEPLPRVDVLAALEAAPDYVVPDWRDAAAPPTRELYARRWLTGLDLEPAAPGRLADLERALESYELVTVPLASGRGGFERTASVVLLRRRDLGLTPRLELGSEEGRLVVRLYHAGHPQLADLALWARSPDGRVLCVTPTGGLSADPATRARPNLLLSATGERPITLFDLPLEQRVAELGELHAVLLNPDAALGAPDSAVSDERTHVFE